jgi:CubicO group peptidase (beta-lactamase class C family)
MGMPEIVQEKQNEKEGRPMNLKCIDASVLGIITLACLARGDARAKTTKAQVTDSANAPVTLSSAPAGSVGFDQGRLGLLNKAMHRLIVEGQVAGIMTMLARHGKIVNCDAYGKDNIAKSTPLRRDSIFRLFSQTKTVTGVAMTILFEQGKWQFDNPISKHIPEFANLKVYAGLDKHGQTILEDPKQPPTMVMLMTNTAGFGYGMKNMNSTDYVNQQLQKLEVLSSRSSQEAIQKIASVPLLYQPGTRWQYSVGVDIQGYLVEKISGQRLGDFLSQYVFAPLGMKDTGFYVPSDKCARLVSAYKFDPEKKKLIELRPGQDPGIGDFTVRPPRDSGGGGDGGGAGGLVSTIDDYARFCQMILNRGTYNGARILAPGSVALIEADHIPATVVPEASGGFPAIGGPALGYGFDFGTIKDPTLIGLTAAPGSVFWGGGAGTWFWIDPENDLFFLGMIQREGDDVEALAMRLAVSQKFVYAALTEPNK